MSNFNEVSAEVEDGSATFRRSAKEAILMVKNAQDDIVMQLTGTKLSEDLQAMCASVIQRHNETLRELLDMLLLQVSHVGDNDYTVNDRSRHSIDSTWERTEDVVHVITPDDGSYKATMRSTNVPENVSDAAVLSAMMDAFMQNRQKMLEQIYQKISENMDAARNVN